MLPRFPRRMSATLPSNNGEARFVIELRVPAEYAHDAGFESSIHLHGEHWDGDHAFPFTTSIEGLWLRAADIKALQEYIIEWLRLPLESQTVKDLNAGFLLARLPEQNLQIRFEPSPEQTFNPHPLVTIHFGAGALRGEFQFVTDQSCLSLFAQELSAELVRWHKFAL